jgi:hypothetical protein
MRHTDQVYVQVEEYQGPNFLYKEEGEVAPDKTGVATPGVNRGAVAVKNVEVKLPEMSPDELKVYYRQQYKTISGEVPDFRWGVTRLKEEIEAWETIHTPPPTTPEDDEEDKDTESDALDTSSDSPPDEEVTTDD